MADPVAGDVVMPARLYECARCKATGRFPILPAGTKHGKCREEYIDAGTKVAVPVDPDVPAALVPVVESFAIELSDVWRLDLIRRRMEHIVRMIGVPADDLADLADLVEGFAPLLRRVLDGESVEAARLALAERE